MVKFKLDDIVIVNNSGALMPGILVSRSVRQKRRVFDVRMENGSLLKYVPVDEKRNPIHIDSYYSKKIGSKIETNLKPGSIGNFLKKDTYNKEVLNEKV